MSGRREIPRYSGVFTLADPVTSAELFGRINEGCNCCCCRSNLEAAEKLLAQEMRELEQKCNLSESDNGPGV